MSADVAALPHLRAGARRVVHCMGTVFSLDVRTPGVSEAALDEATQWLHLVDETFSTYRAQSEISRLARGEITPAECSAEVRAVLAECARLEAETRGYFSARATGALDPSGYVKGWAIERASDILAAHGSRSHCVNGGGDVQCAGSAAVGRPWRIGIADPLRHGDLAAVVVGDGLAIATSGVAERGSHIVDPHTGLAPSALASITLVGLRLARVDAMATAAFAMDCDARAFVEDLDGVEAFAVTAGGTTWATSGWRR
jgi:thiamine biosynthesis lipoprotein